MLLTRLLAGYVSWYMMRAAHAQCVCVRGGVFCCFAGIRGVAFLRRSGAPRGAVFHSARRRCSPAENSLWWRRRLEWRDVCLQDVCASVHAELFGGGFHQFHAPQCYHMGAGFLYLRHHQIGSGWLYSVSPCQRRRPAVEPLMLPCT